MIQNVLILHISGIYNFMCIFPYDFLGKKLLFEVKKEMD
jgi:hypothetical protein